MDNMKGREDVSFPTLDGLTLRGWLYPAAQKGPAIIMTPGVCTSTLLPKINQQSNLLFAVQYDQGNYHQRCR